MPFDLAKALKSISANRDLDPMREQMAEATRVGRQRIKQDSADQRIARAKAQELSILDSLEMLQTLPDSDLKTVRINNALGRLGELYAEQGRWAEAVSVTEDPARRAMYEETLAAITTPIESVCECPDDIIFDHTKQTRIRQKAMQPVGQIVDDGRLVTLKTCRKCGFSNTE
jgi:hypothetical protein